MNLGPYLRELLFDHDCIIVDGFGAFVCQEFDAHINGATQMFVPPSKKVSFQSALFETNFLLERHISSQLNVTLERAKAIVSTEVGSWKHDLEQGCHVKLDEVGRMYVNTEKRIAFQADINANFNRDTFGMGIFRFPELREEPLTPVKGAAMASVKKTNKISGLWQKAAIAAAVVGLFYIGSEKPDFNAVDIASFNPSRLFTTDEMPAQNATYADEAAKEEFATSLGGIHTEIKELPELLEVQTNGQYHIIVGAFKVKENANAYMQQLKSSGLENAQYFYEKSFYRVSAGDFVSRKEAVIALSAIKRKVQKGAWIYRK